jgi:two-component sensor histidine kinase
MVSFAPDAAWKRWLLALAFWTALGLFFATQAGLAYTYQQGWAPWGLVIRLSLGEWYIWALLSPGVLWLARRFPLEGGRLGRALVVHVPAALLFTIAKILIEEHVMWRALGLKGGPNPASKLHFAFLTYWAIVGVSHGIQYYQRYRERELKASQLEARLAEARLEALRMQLQPHFLFNTLHAISTLMHRDVEAAERMLARLSDLLRLTLESSGEPEVPLQRELEFLEPYLEIERTRFADRLTVNLTVEPGALAAPVPSLLLQPLVENAVRHGIAPRAKPGRVDIRARREKNRLQLEIEDDGCGLRQNWREGLGLKNTRARLEQLYGTEHKLELLPARSYETGALVRLTLPLKGQEGPPTEGPA